MSDIITILRALVQQELASLRLGDLGVVTRAYPRDGQDTRYHECDVRLREGQLELRQVPLSTPHVGMVSAPQAGDLVLVHYVGGDPQRPIVIGRLYSVDSPPPDHAATEWRVCSPHPGKTSIAIDKDHAVVITAGATVVTVKQGDAVEIATPKDLKVEAKGKVQLTCQDCQVEASGDITLGAGGAGVITEQSHHCYFTGAPLKGSMTVKAKV